jgi:hypothetical protein
MARSIGFVRVPIHTKISWRCGRLAGPRVLSVSLGGRLVPAEVHSQERLELEGGGQVLDHHVIEALALGVLGIL